MGVRAVRLRRWRWSLAWRFWFALGSITTCRRSDRTAVQLADGTSEVLGAAGNRAERVVDNTAEEIRADAASLDERVEDDTNN